MRAYRVDEYLGAVTEFKALFFDKYSVNEYISFFDNSNNLGIVEIEISDNEYIALQGRKQ